MRIPIQFAPFAFAIAAFAQPGAVSGPGAGLVFDPAAQALRPIRGVPGSATFGDPIDAGYKLSAAWLSPSQDSAFTRDSGGALHFFAIGAAGLAEFPLAAVSLSPQRIIFSPTGSSAALYSDGQVQIITGLPSSPKVADAFLLGHGARNARPSVSSMTLTDDGAYLLFSAGGSIQLANASEGSRVLTSAGFGAAVAFAPNSRDAAIAAPGTGALILHDVANTAVPQPLAADDAAFAQIAGIAFEPTGRRVFIASASSSSVVSLDAATGTRSDYTCSFRPTGLTRMGTAFRLNEFSSGPLWLLDQNSSTPRVVFVPAWKAGL
jgi:hypothetical protein